MLDPVSTFNMLFNKNISDSLIISIYRGAWGSTFLYFFGYLLVAHNPTKHTGIVIIGTIGKIFFAFNLLLHYFDGVASSFAIIVI